MPGNLIQFIHLSLDFVEDAAAIGLYSHFPLFDAEDFFQEILYLLHTFKFFLELLLAGTLAILYLVAHSLLNTFNLLQT